MITVQMFYLCLTIGNSVLASGNIALYKPAYQSSVIYSSSYSMNPGNAVDGYSSMNMNSGRCTGTKDEDLHPWWMVDLGTAFKIHNITIAIRSDTSKKNFYDFYIEMFLVNPLTWGFLTPQQCLFYNGTFPHSTKETLTCDVPVTGRFVRIRKIPIADNESLRPMYLCEVEIRGTETQRKQCRPNNVPVYGGKMLLTASQLVVAADCLPDCLSRCYFNVDCKGINYNSLTKSCEIILARSENDTLVDDLEWRFVSLPYTTWCGYQW